MNKQEAIRSLQEMAQESFEVVKINAVHIDNIVEVINQIDEPHKVVIPKFVAEWLEYCKIAYRDLQMILSRLDHDRKVGDWAYDENDDLIPEKVDMIARAWLDGYEIEQDKEKLYTVEIMDTILTKVTRGRNIQYKMLPSVTFPNVFDKATYTTKLTEQEIKQKDEWLWQSAKEVVE